MAKIVYDPTEDRKHKNAKVFNASPKQGEKPKKIQYDPKREPKGTATVKKAAETEKPKTEKKPAFTDEQFIAALKAIDHPATSREISDKLGIADPEVGRQFVRTRMAKLAEEGKVVIKEASEGVRAGKLYNLP